MANIKYRKSDGTYETITNYNVQPLVPVQETGDSVIDVMSQKAVTDAINNITVEAGQNIEITEDNTINVLGYKFDSKTNSISTTETRAIGDYAIAEGCDYYGNVDSDWVEDFDFVVDSNVIQLPGHNYIAGQVLNIILLTPTSEIEFFTRIDSVTSDTINIDKQFTVNRTDCDYVCLNKLFCAYGYASHKEGYNTTSSGPYSHVEGSNTVTINSFEHAQGQYNKSNEQTLHSIGIGSSVTRRNAQEVMSNGDFYVYGIGKYDGTNPTESQTLQTVINNNLDIVNTRTYTLDFGTSSDLIQDINMIGNITINNIQTYNVNKLFITYGNVVHSEITNFTDMGISIDKNFRIIWEIERINDEELACVGIESKINN